MNQAIQLKSKSTTFQQISSFSYFKSKLGKIFSSSLKLQEQTHAVRYLFFKFYFFLF